MTANGKTHTLHMSDNALIPIPMQLFLVLKSNF